jgi:uncharacterized protein (DUF1330 family)
MTKSALTICSVFFFSFLIGSAAAEDKKSDIGAYFILTQTITDPDKYRSEYIPQVLQFIAKHGGKIVVAKHDAEPLEGSPAKGVVVLRFPSEEAVRNFVNDPEYQPAKKIRHAITTNANAVLAPQFQRPKAN